MFNNLGIQWAGTLLGCLAACLVPIPICFYLFGKKLRRKSKFAPTMATKKPATDEESSSESDNESRMAALHASRSRVDQDTEIIRHRSRARTNGSALTGSNTNAQAQEKNT